MPTIGWLSAEPPVEPQNTAPPNVKTPPSDRDHPVATPRVGRAADDRLEQRDLERVAGVPGTAEGHDPARGVHDGVRRVRRLERTGRARPRLGSRAVGRHRDERGGGKERRQTESGTAARPPRPPSRSRHEAKIIGSPGAGVHAARFRGGAAARCPRRSDRPAAQVRALRRGSGPGRSRHGPRPPTRTMPSTRSRSASPW